MMSAYCGQSSSRPDFRTQVPGAAMAKLKPKSAVFLHLVHVSKWVHICLESNASPSHISPDLKRPMVPHDGWLKPTECSS
jgi:hypothetical protein